MQKGKTDIILVESGATKSDWRVLGEHGNVKNQAFLPGMNLSTMRMEDILGILSEAFDSGLFHGGIKGFYLYAAGVVTDSVRDKLTTYLRSRADIDDVDIEDDLTGAARAVCGHSPGIAAILGTGSNACFYDGTAVSREVYSGGYILGDEGSAATLGKLFLSDYLKRMVPENVAEDFRRSFDSTYTAIIDGVYHSASPSAFLGSLAPFIVSYMDVPYISSLIKGNFKAYIDRILTRYDVSKYPVGIVGSFGWACRDILVPMLEQSGITVSKVIKDPVDELCKYHIVSR
jgi:N-acetylglucosamine kinase-like BadF-type ATPase